MNRNKFMIYGGKEPPSISSTVFPLLFHLYSHSLFLSLSRSLSLFLPLFLNHPHTFLNWLSWTYLQKEVFLFWDYSQSIPAILIHDGMYDVDQAQSVGNSAKEIDKLVCVIECQRERCIGHLNKVQGKKRAKRESSKYGEGKERMKEKRYGIQTSKLSPISWVLATNV